jgi:hypothetical protein
VHELPSRPGFAGTLSGLAGPIAGDAVADGIEAAELLDVEVDDLAGRGALIARPGLGGLERAEEAETAASEDAADGGRGQTRLGGDRGLGAALTAQGLDRIARGGRRLAWR